MLDTAKEYEKLGLLPIPLDYTENKVLTTNVAWVNNPKTVEGWKVGFNKNIGIGLVLGSRGGNLQVVDVDQKHDSTASLSAKFMEAIKYMLPDVHDSFYIEETRSGGLHVFFKRVGEVDAKIIPAKTLEFNENTGKQEEAALIEVLGQGQMAYTYPTPNYKILQGSIEEIPTITDKQFSELILVCKSFNELPDAEVVVSDYEYSASADDDDTRAGTIFNRKCDPVKFAAYMVQNNWKVAKMVGDKYWFTRPDKDNGVSATFNHDGRKLFCVFSSSTEFETHHNKTGKMKGHTPFSVLTKLTFNGDFKKAASYLIEKGDVSPDEWEEVEPLEPIKVNPFDLDELIPPSCEDFKKYIAEIAESYQVLPEMALLPAISAISLMICGAARVQIKDDWHEDAPIWSIVVAEASERKSPVLKEIMTPIEKYFENFGLTHKRDLNELGRRKRGLSAAIEVTEKEYEKALASGKDTGAISEKIRDIEDSLDECPEIIELPNLIQSDITPEALVKQLKTNGEVCGVISAEADPIEVALGLYSGKANFSAYLKGFSVERYTSNRIGGGEIVLEQPRIVLSVMMQREPMETLAENRAARKRGFLARCFFAVPNSKVGSRALDVKGVSSESKHWWIKKVDSILSIPHRLRLNDEGSTVAFNNNDPATIFITERARALLWEAREVNEEGLRAGGDFDDESGWGGKLIGNICRLAMALHFLSGKGVTDKLDEVTMEYALKWVKPLTEHYYCAVGHVGEMGIDKRVHSAVLKLNEKQHETKLPIRDVYQLVRNKRYSKASDWEPVWDRMIELGFIRVKNIEKRGAKGGMQKIIHFHPNFANLAKST